jgi:hypothetical protein
MGCATGYLKNMRDDVLDLGTLAVGLVPPVVPGEDGEPVAVGLIPPAFGLYFQFTEFFHLGALYKITGDLAWDRRGYGTIVDKRTKIGVGPFHYVNIQQTPKTGSPYKFPGSVMAGWQEHMNDLRDPVFHAPAKTMIFEPVGRDPDKFYIDDYDYTGLPYLHRGWQDWEFISMEVAIPCPFICHHGFYFRAGVDPSQILDLAFSMIGLDLYADAAYNLDGSLKY